MRLFPRRDAGPAARLGRSPRALTAAATVASKETEGGLVRLVQDWQQRAFAMYDSVGECWYPAQSYARALEKTRFFPAILNERGEAEEVETGPLVDLFQRIRDPGGTGMTDLAGAYGRLQFINGDGYLIISNADGDDEEWEYLSVAELRVERGTKPGEKKRYRRLRLPGGVGEELFEASDDDFEPMGDQVRVFRLHRRHPKHSDLADAPIKPVLDLYELLLRLTLASSAEAKSRAAQRGLFYIANEIADALRLEGPDDDPESDPLLRSVREGFEAAIANPDDASAMMPFVMRGPGIVQTDDRMHSAPIKDLVGWIPLGPTDRYLEGEMWEKTIHRIATGLDLPTEFLTGTGEINHWGGWLLDEQGYRLHVAPTTQRFCNDLAGAYLRPAAREEEIANWERVTVGYDPADAIIHPDKVATAKDAHAALVVSDEFYRDQIGATKEDAPSGAELERRTLVLLKKVPPGMQTSEPPPELAPTDGGRGGDVVEGPPAAPTDQTERNGGPPAAAAAILAARIHGAAELHVERVREIAGARLTRRSQSCAECRERIKSVRASLVAATLGRETVREIIAGYGNETSLVEGAGASLATTLRSWGIADEWPDDLARLVEQHALRTIYDAAAPPLPPGFQAAVSRAVA